MQTDLWCIYFISKENRKELLVLMKPVVEVTGGIDVVIYNSQALLLGLEPIPV